MLYLASPYSHPDPAQRDLRYEYALKATATLMLCGKHVFSPIVHNHHVAKAMKAPTGWDFWLRYDTEILSKCEELLVLKLAGWDRSVGVTAEIAFAMAQQIPIAYTTMAALKAVGTEAD